MPTMQLAHPLQGTGTGTYHGPAVTIDAGTSFILYGTVKLNGLGTRSVMTTLQGHSWS